MFEKTKKYLEEHPKVKKALIITGRVAGAAAAGFVAYKAVDFVATKKGYSSEAKKYAKHHTVKEMQTDIDRIQEKIDNELRQCKEAPHHVLPDPAEFRRADIPLVQDDHTFDMTFKDTLTGDSYTAKDSCLGSYVNDMLQSFEDTEIEISVDKA